MGHGKSRPLRNLSKKKGFVILNNNVKKDYEVVKIITNYKWSEGGKCVSGSFCWKSLCVVSFISFFHLPSFMFMKLIAQLEYHLLYLTQTWSTTLCYCVSDDLSPFPSQLSDFWCFDLGLCCLCHSWPTGWCCYLYGPWGSWHSHNYRYV